MTQNLAASVHQRLLNRARAEGRPFNELLQYYVLERFLYRLGQSSFADHFVLKGALLLGVWQAPLSRPTRDIDLLGRLSNDVDQLVAIMRQICLAEVAAEDGLLFHTDAVTGEEIIEAGDYHGVRVHMLATLGNAQTRFPVDIGFGDPLVPGPTKVQLPALLNMTPPELLVYSRESVVAEKFHAMVLLGELNSRMKDFYDIWLLARQAEFTGEVLAKAIAATFAHRRTLLAPIPLALTGGFGERPDKIVQWRAFVRRHSQLPAPATLTEAVHEIAAFLLPVVSALIQGQPYQQIWSPGGPWQDRDNHHPL